MSSALVSLKKNFVSLLAIIAAMLLGACGGGGDVEIGYPSITYTGSTTAAVIDQSNAADFPFVMLEGSSGSGDLVNNLPLAASIDPEAADGIPNPENIKKVAGTISDLIKNNLSNSALVSGATESITGSCGGSATVTANDTGSSISGSMQFDNYCEVDPYGYQLSMHGRITFSASYYLDVDVPVLTSFNMTIQYLKMALNDGNTTVSEEFSGSITVGFDPVTHQPVDFTMSVNFVYEGKIFKIVNLQVDDLVGTISGTFYHPDHGYVIITTDPANPFVYDSITEQFCGGTLHIEGSDGAVPVSSTAIIDFTADATCTTYDICVTINTDPQICSPGNTWGTAPVWP
jgi:hypothetical protein